MQENQQAMKPTELAFGTVAAAPLLSILGLPPETAW